MKLPVLNRIPALALILLSLTLTACNLPRAAEPTPLEFPTPNQTLTSVFATVQAATQTEPSAPGGEATPAVPPSATFLPTRPAPTATPGSPAQPPAPTQPPSSPTRAQPTAVPPTRTPVSYAGPGARSGPSVEAVFFEREPTIDGVFDEWDLERYEVSRVVYGGAQVGGEEDLSAWFMTGWDEEALYIAARVFDDEYVQNASGENIFEGDSIEILLDTNVGGDFHLDALSPDDYQLGITAGSPTPGTATEAYLWYPTEETGRARTVSAAGGASDNGYRIETRIPWEVFGVRAETGRHFGFAFSVSDNDRPGRSEQQSMVSNIARDLTDPTTWGDLVLSGRRTSGAPPSGAFAALYVERSHVIDGDLGEWDVDRLEFDQVVYGADQWEDADDLSGRLLLAWDEARLYIGVRVFDDQYAQNSRGEELFLGDSIEILLDADLEGDARVRELNGDDYQLGLSPGTEPGVRGMDAYLWFPRSQAGLLEQVNLAASDRGDGYSLEAAIPWSVFGLRPQPGDRFGFVLSISDNDRPNRAVQQSMVSIQSRRVLTDPTTWGVLVLRDN